MLPGISISEGGILRTSDAEADDLDIFFHCEGSPTSGPSHSSEFGLCRARVIRRAAARCGITPCARCTAPVQKETIHPLEELARELEHLLRRGGKLSGTGGGLLDEFAHFVHRANDGLRP